MPANPGVMGMALLGSGARRLRPGIYALNGEMHIDAEELLIDQGIEPNADTIAALERAAGHVAAQYGIEPEIVEWSGGHG